MADTELDIDDLCDDIRRSMYADDRQTSAELRRGEAALNRLAAEIERLRARVAELEQAHAERVAGRETETLIRATATKLLREVSAYGGLLDGFSNLRSAWKDLQAIEEIAAWCCTYDRRVELFRWAPDMSGALHWRCDTRDNDDNLDLTTEFAGPDLWAMLIEVGSWCKAERARQANGDKP